MEDRQEFRCRVRAALDDIGPEVLSYAENEFWMIQTIYEQIEFYASQQCLFNTSIALPLGRGLHNGVYRKSKFKRGGTEYSLPYFVHPLLVCRMLLDLHIPIVAEELDILLAAALCHDMIEDIKFPHQGRELVELYHLDPRVLETVQKVSKRQDFSEEEERSFFHGIESHKLALLVKLSDRGNNVEDLYNRSLWKVHEYVGETRKYFLPMCTYGKKHYPEIEGTIEILEDKMLCLTETAETLVDRYDLHEQELRSQLDALRQENNRLRAIWKQLWDN